MHKYDFNPEQPLDYYRATKYLSDMPTHAILGATGATGSAVLRFLLSLETSRPRINVFVRSKTKLVATFPKLEREKDVYIFASPLSDHATMKQCLKDTEVIYNCVATNISKRGVDVARSSADAVLSSLQELREDNKESFLPPLLVLLRSSMLAHEKTNLAERLPMFALGHLFDDLKAACEMYKSAANENLPLLTYIFVDPPGLHDPDGVERTGFELIKNGNVIRPDLNYADLGAAMVEAGNREMEFKNQAVGVSATGRVRTSYATLMGYLLTGLRHRLLPF